MSDQEYNAALELEVWCDKKIEEGFHSFGELTLRDRLMYFSLVINQPFYYTEGSECDRLKEKANILAKMLKIKMKLIIRDHCG